MSSCKPNFLLWSWNLATHSYAYAYSTSQMKRSTLLFFFKLLKGISYEMNSKHMLNSVSFGRYSQCTLFLKPYFLSYNINDRCHMKRLENCSILFHWVIQFYFMWVVTTSLGVDTNIHTRLHTKPEPILLLVLPIIPSRIS